MEVDEWHPPPAERYPTRPGSFPAAGVNALAPFGSRVVARIVDALVVLLPAFLLFLVAFAVLLGTDPDLGGDDPRVAVALTGSVFVASVLYETTFVTLWGQTLGKMLVGIRVARQANGRSPVWWEAAIRVALPGVVAAVPHPAAAAASLVLYGAAFFDPVRRSVPDRAAGTVVVRAR